MQEAERPRVAGWRWGTHTHPVLHPAEGGTGSRSETQTLTPSPCCWQLSPWGRAVELPFSAGCRASPSETRAAECQAFNLTVVGKMKKQRWDGGPLPG